MKITDLRINQEVTIKHGQGFKKGQTGIIIVIDDSHEVDHVTLLIDDGEQTPFESPGFTLEQIEQIKTVSDKPENPFVERRTLRDEFAAKAIDTAFKNLTNENNYFADGEQQKNNAIGWPELARETYGIADAMLKEREKE